MNSELNCLHEVSYSKRSGLVYRWGRPIGHIDGKGYLSATLGGKSYRLHRVAFLLVTGAWPNHTVDHKNGIKTDNRWGNLRDVSQGKNNQNLHKPRANGNSGYLGVSWSPKRGKWVAQIRVHGVKITLGYRDCPEVAHALYVQAKRSMHEGNTL